jgi:hypothetical protein
VTIADKGKFDGWALFDSGHKIEVAARHISPLRTEVRQKSRPHKATASVSSPKDSSGPPNVPFAEQSLNPILSVHHVSGVSEIAVSYLGNATDLEKNRQPRLMRCGLDVASVN